MRDCCFPSGRNRLCRISFLGYRIISASSPRVAAEDSACREVESFDRSVLAEGLESVCGTGGSETAGWRLQRRDAHLIESDEHNEWEDRDLLECR